jgi:hypothetical protein
MISKFLSKLVLLIFVIISSKYAHAKTCTSVGTGNFGAGGTWSCSPAGAPACGDVIIIEVGHTVTLSNNLQWHNGGCAGSPTTVIVNGTLTFTGGGKLQLATGSNVIINPGGVLSDDNYTGNNNLIDIGGVNIWNASVEGGPVSGPWQNGNSTLPITLRSFYGIQDNSTVQLYWSTASELNNHFFTIERSEDGENWKSIGNHNGGNNSNTELYYSFGDKNPIIGTSYYRLVQTDYDGVSETFEPIKINFIKKSSFLMFPNPAQDIVTLTFNDDYIFNQITFYDVFGKLVLLQDIENSTNLTFDITSLPKGIYFVSCKGDRTISTQKLVIE